MCLITISRGTMSGSVLLAEELGRQLGATVLDRQQLVASDTGLAAMEALLRDEIDTLPEYLWEELESLRHAYLSTLRSALLDRAEQGPLVYHANGGQLLLRRIPGLLRLRVVAPVAMRVEMVGDRLGFDSRRASAYIREKDQRREHWNRFLFGVPSLDADVSYDLVLNLEELSPIRAAEIVRDVSLQPPFGRSREVEAGIADEALAARVRAVLARNPNTRMLEIEVTVRGGAATLIFDETRGPLADEVRHLASKVGGVRSLTLSEREVA